MIKANQGIRPKKPRPLGTSLEHGDWNWELSRPIPFATSRLCAFALKTRYQPSIKAKTPAIKANRASSRQTMKIMIPLGNQPQSERGSVTRSNALSPDRVRVSITTPAGLATLLRFTEPRSVRLARNPRPETHARFPNQGKQ